MLVGNQTNAAACNTIYTKLAFALDSVRAHAVHENNISAVSSKANQFSQCSSEAVSVCLSSLLFSRILPVQMFSTSTLFPR